MLLELKNIKKYFPATGCAVVKAVDNVSLSVKRRENLSLVGESGCGKTTLARMIVKLMPLDQGSVWLNGDDVTRISRKKLLQYRKKVQMVFQDPYSSLDPRFMVRDIIKEAMVLDDPMYQSEQQKEKKAIELLLAVGLQRNVMDRYPHEFSGGERQRIAIARALAMNPKLLILDEAVSSLDVVIQQQVLDLLKDLQASFDLTYLFISHNLKIVRRISHRIAVMYKGKIVEAGPTKEIFENPLHEYTKELLAAAIDYKAVKRDEEIVISDKASLVEKEEGHFVLI